MSGIVFILYQTMQTNAAVFRDGPTLQEGCQKMDQLFKDMDDVQVDI